MQMMSTRHEEIANTIEGFNASNVPIVALDQYGYHASGMADNFGLYYFVPQLAKYFNLSVDMATTLFLISLLALGTSIAICCFFFIFNNWISRIAASFGLLLLAQISYNCSDVYIAYFFGVSTTVPLFLLLKHRLPKSKYLFLGILAFSGIMIGYSNIIRKYSGTTALIFLVLWMMFNLNLKKKTLVLYIGLLFVFSLIPFFHGKNLEKNRNAFLEQNQPSGHYQPRPFPTWHLFYIGLGYFENDYGLYHKDECAAEKVKSINPEVAYLSEEYNQILRGEYFLLLKSAPWFILKTYLMKLLILCWKFLKYTNLGLIGYFYVRPSWRELLPFLAAASFAALPGIVAEPQKLYVLGMVSLSAIFGVYMIGLSLEKIPRVSELSYGKFSPLNRLKIYFFPK
ncbi:MAG: hypothetical protein K1060chlam2_00276 [Chlamydiae bacterium]|nr:hypothetical protein [Chlamydiota bacterium]